jgi:hypothetical protein
MTDYRFEYIKNQMTDELLVEQQKTNDETIQTLKEDIAILQEKLQKLEELQRTKSPVEEAYKKVYGAYPPTTPSVSNFEDTRWSAFQNGYNASKVSETPQEPEELKTLYDALQCPLHINGYHFNEDQKDWICDIVEKWLPDELSCDNGVHNGVYELGWNDAIETIKDKLK